MSQSTALPYPDLNYIWIGPPSEKGGIPGHDITGPIEMAKANPKNPIHFWCLEEHKNASSV